jgi:membrane protease YdiL (CAAX protease family)
MVFACGFLLVRWAPPTYFLPIVAAYHVVGLVLSFAYFRWSGRPLADFGLTFRGTKAALRRALIVCAVIAPLAIGARLVCDALALMPPNTPFFTLRLTLPYILLIAPTQELIHRGAIHTATRDFIEESPSRPLKVASFGTFVFAWAHLFRPPMLALAVIPASLAYGLAFEKDRTIVGVSLSHAFLGWFALECLSLQDVRGLLS